MCNVHFENKVISRRFFLFIWIMYSVVYMTKSCFSGAMSLIVSEGVMTKSQTGFIMSAFSFAYAPLQIVGGAFADKYDPEKLIKIALIGGGLANLIIFLNQNYYLVLTVWVLNAVVQFALWPSVFKIVSSQLVQEDRKKGTYYITFGINVGLFLSFLLAAFLPSWEYNFAVSSFSLFALAIIWHIVTKRTEKYMIPDIKSENDSSKDTEVIENISTFKIFLISGFLILVIISFIRAIIESSIKSFSATILMESYINVSPRIGNLLNIVIIISGVIGSVITREILYPKYIKSAPVGILVMLFATLIGATALLFIGKANIYIIVVAMCLISACLSAVFLLCSFCNLRFTKFGKSGTAAGFLNAAGSFGGVVSGYGVTKVAEKYNWNAVSLMFFIAMVISIVLAVVVIPLWKKFKKKYHPHSLKPLVRH